MQLLFIDLYLTLFKVEVHFNGGVCLSVTEVLYSGEKQVEKHVCWFYSLPIGSMILPKTTVSKNTRMNSLANLTISWKYEQKASYVELDLFGLHFNTDIHY